MEVKTKMRPLLWLWAGLVLLVLAFFLDDAQVQWVTANRSATWEAAAKFCSRFLAWHWLMAWAAIALLVAWLLRRRDVMRVVLVMMIAGSIAGLTADFLRGMTGRARPYVQEANGFYGVRKDGEWLIIRHAYNSFPSGHTSAAMGFVMPLLLWRRWLAVFAVPFVMIVGGARMYLGAHHISDIVAGVILGSLIGIWVWQRAARVKWLNQLSR